MMRYLALVLLCVLQLFAYEATKGTTLFLTFEKEVKTLVVGEKKYPLFEHPVDASKKILWLPVPYRSKGDIKAELRGDFAPKQIVIHVKDGNYKKEQLKVAKDKAKPPKSVQDRIWREYKEAMDIYNTTTPKRYFTKPFVFPLDSKITSEYGNARLFNKSVKSFHSGTDFRAPVGTDIYASNDGVVVIAKDRYYAGGSVVIDHGEGIYTSYYHLSDILVEKGQKVKQNELLAKSGKSGRVTGPHLHFGVTLFAKKIDPKNFIAGINQYLVKN